MATITVPQDTAFTFDILGRYGCNTLDEALDSTDRNKHPDARQFDFIVIGGGSFGAVLASQLFSRDKSRAHRILVLEAGPLALPEHIQNLPPGFSPPGKDNPGTIWGQPWQSDSPMNFNTRFPGLAYCIGGRSLFWGGWSPYFIDSEVTDPSWPQSVVSDLMDKVVSNNTESYLDKAARCIGSDISNDFVNGPLHEHLRDRLFTGLTNRTTATEDDILTGNRGKLDSKEELEAPLAVASTATRPGFFALNKFSGVQLLLRSIRVAQSEAEAATGNGNPNASADERRIAVDAKKRIMLVNNCHVTRLERVGNQVTKVFVKYQGVERAIEVPVFGKVFLALGTIENTRLAKNTVPEKELIGRNLMAHLRSNLTFRVLRSAFGDALDPDKQSSEELRRKLRELQISALFVKGIHTHPSDGSKGHYHFQITASGVGKLGIDSEAELFKKIPNIEELDQFKELTDNCVVITVRGIGEMVGDKVSADPQNRITIGDPDGNQAPRAKVRLETNAKNASDPRLTDPENMSRTKDNDLWDAMDNAALEIAGMFAQGGSIQYLSHPNRPHDAVWQADPPINSFRRDTLSTTHHESGTLWMGDNPESSVTDEWGRIWELNNTYVVGPALLPTIGSPNPMLSGVALALRTADHLLPRINLPLTEEGFEYIFDGTERTFHRWKNAGPGAMALQDGKLVAQPSQDHSIFYYAAETFDNFILRLQFQLPGPRDSFGKAIGNSGIFLRFRHPSVFWTDVNQKEAKAQSNPAWVAPATGFEVQIDEQGTPDYQEKHRTGAIYNIATGEIVNGIPEPEEQMYNPGPVLEPMRWYEYEIEVNGNEYTVRLKEDGETGYRELTKFQQNGQYADRGIPTSVDERSGYLGLQTHTGQVAFRNIWIKKLI